MDKIFTNLITIITLFHFRLFILSLYFVSKYVQTDLASLLYVASVVIGFGAAGKVKMSLMENGT